MLSPSASGSRSLRFALLREPLVLFFIAGAVLFGLDGAIDAFRGKAVIDVPAPVRAAAVAKLQASLGRAASEEELRAAIDSWVREEAIYREGLRRGLDRSDGVIRERVVHRTLAAIQREYKPFDIDDTELERWFSARVQRYAQPAVFDLEVITLLDVPTDPELSLLLERLNRPGQQAFDIGLNARLHIYRDAPESLLVRSYGAQALGVARSAEPGRWVRASTEQSVLIVRVQKARTEESPRFQEIRSRVLDDWRREQREQALEQALKQLVQQYRIRDSAD